MDFGPTRAKAEGRDPYLAPELWALFPDALDDEDRPVGWQEKKLSEIIDRLPAGKLYDQKTVLPVGKVPVFDQGKSGIIGYHNNKPNIIASQKKRVATFANHTCLLRIVDHPFSTIQNVIPFIGSKLPTEWVYFATIGKQNFEEYKGHWPSLMNKDITVPNASSTEMFAMIVDTLLNKISFNNKESDYLAKTRDLLLPKLMSGEICLRETEKFVEAAT